MKGLYVVATAAALALSLLAGVAGAAQPCGRQVIDDWYDNGVFDRSWDCQCLREALAQFPDTRGTSRAKDNFQRQLELTGCDGSGAPIVTMTFSTPAPGSDESIGVSDDFPWDVAIVGGLTLGLAGLVAIAVQRQRRRN